MQDDVYELCANLLDMLISLRLLHFSMTGFACVFTAEYKDLTNVFEIETSTSEPNVELSCTMSEIMLLML